MSNTSHHHIFFFFMRVCFDIPLLVGVWNSCAWRNSSANAKMRPITATRASAASRPSRTAFIVSLTTPRTSSSFTTCAKTLTSWLTKPTARPEPIIWPTVACWSVIQRAPATGVASIHRPRPVRSVRPVDIRSNGSQHVLNDFSYGPISEQYGCVRNGIGEGGGGGGGGRLRKIWMFSYVLSAC